MAADRRLIDSIISSRSCSTAASFEMTVVAPAAVMKFNQTEIAGFPDGNSYNTREEAVAAAFVKAKTFIDESVPSNHPMDNAFS